MVIQRTRSSSRQMSDGSYSAREGRGKWRSRFCGTIAPVRTPPRIASITVTFNPDLSRLGEQLAALRGEVDERIVVDNASTPAIGELLAREEGPVHLLALDDNVGVAGAFNIGIGEARRRGADFALLLDHDSIPTPGMVAALVEGYRRSASLSGVPVAAVGPRVVDARDRKPYPFIRLGWTHNAHLHCAADGEAAIACDFLISSGTLVSLEHFDRVGPFDETLFVDSVDLEWCCRARSLGFALYGVCGARLDHWLGDRRREVVRGVALVVHPPQRLYYMTRNRFLLYQRPYMPFKWKVKDILRVAAKFTATMLFLAPRREYCSMSWRALRDAIRGRGGKYVAG
jgi:rhamnosyltransferase